MKNLNLSFHGEKNEIFLQKFRSNFIFINVRENNFFLFFIKRQIFNEKYKSG